MKQLHIKWKTRPVGLNLVLFSCCLNLQLFSSKTWKGAANWEEKSGTNSRDYWDLEDEEILKR